MCDAVVLTIFRVVRRFCIVSIEVDDSSTNERKKGDLEVRS